MADISSITLPGGGTYDLKDKNAVPKYGMGKNLLDNSDFTNPVNQRGQSSYTGANTYGISRWKTTSSSGSKIEIGAGAVNVSETGSSYGGMLQIINKESLLGKTTTLSVLYKRKSGDVYNISLRQGILNNIGSALSTVTALSGEIDELNLAKVTVIVPSTIAASNNIFFAIHAPNSPSSVDVIATKLELGTEQTLAHQENGTWILNEIPDYEEELIKCQTSTADPADIYANKVISTNVSKPNLLRNWYFINPVNQRGNTSGTTTNNAYFLDGWKTTYGTSSGTWALISSGLQVTSAASTYAVIMQNIDDTLLNGFALTASLLLSDGTIDTATLASRTSGTSQYFGSGVSWQLDANGIFRHRVYNTQTIVAIKLELGTEQTLAHQENDTWVLNEIPDYEEELYRCITSTADSSDTYANKSLATRQDLTSIEATGTTNTTGAAIPAGAYFYLNGVLNQAKTQIDVNATFTPGTNCESTTVGDEFGNLYTIDGTSVSATANTDTNISITAPNGYRYGVFVGFAASSDYTKITLITVAAQGVNYPNRIRFRSTVAQTVTARVLWFK